MVDYKNAERIRQLYVQLTASERLRAFELLRSQFQEEDKLRKEQGFDSSLEPTTAWTPPLERFLEEVKTGDPHPDFFKKFSGHPLDPLFPLGFEGRIATFVYYDLWCQIMIRVILTCRSAYDLDDLIALDEPLNAQLAGKLVSFRGPLRGKVAIPEDWRQIPISKTVLAVKANTTSWRSILELKTHYVYSMTAASSLSKGTANGLVIMRSIDSVRSKGKKRRVILFSCTPLIIGNGALDIPYGSN